MKQLDRLIQQRDNLQGQIATLVSEERRKLKQQIRQLESLTGSNHRPMNSMSPEAREKISKAQKARWASKKAAKGK